MKKFAVAIAMLALTIGGVSPAEAAKGRQVATRGEYDRLQFGMSRAEVTRFFGTAGKVVVRRDLEVFVKCSPNTKIFCVDEDGSGNGVVYAGASEKRKYFTGYANRFDYRPGRACFSINLTYIRDARGTYRLRKGENYSNTCYTNQNRNY